MQGSFGLLCWVEASVLTHLVQTTASVKAVRELWLINVYLTSLGLVVKQKPG